jgi:hypothetical protein
MIIGRKTEPCEVSIVMTWASVTVPRVFSEAVCPNVSVSMVKLL